MLTPYPFDKLRKFNSAQKTLVAPLLSAFPSSGYEPKLVQDVAANLKPYLGDSFRFRYESLFDCSYAQFLENLPERFLILVVSLTPLSKKIIIEIDPLLSLALIDKLVGGAGKMPEAARPPTPLEEGVLQFLVVKVLKELSTSLSGEAHRLRLDRVITQLRPLHLLEEEGAVASLVTFRFRVDHQEGYLRIAFTHSFLSELSRAQPVFDPDGIRSDEFYAGRFKGVDHFRNLLWAEVGKVTLTAHELASLSRGDVLLLEECYPVFDGKKLQGGIRLRLGQGTGGFLDGDVEPSEGSLKVRLRSAVQE